MKKISDILQRDSDSKGLGPLGMLGAGEVIQGLGGAIFGGINDRRQLRQNWKLQGQNQHFAKDMARFNFNQQLDMWNATGPQAYKNQLIEAGLNPAMMYGMGGGGGQTASVNSASPSGATAAGHSGEMLGMAQMAGQVALIKAQKENIEADTANKKMNTTKQDQEQFGIGLDNAVKNWLLNKDENGNDIGTNEDGDASAQDSIIIKQKTAEMKKAAQEALNAEVQNRLMEQGIKVDQATIAKMSADILQRAKEIELSGRQVSVQELLAQFNTDWENIIGREAIGVVGNIISSLPILNKLRGMGEKQGVGNRTTHIHNYKNK